MAQLCLYIDDQTLRKLQKTAQLEQVSVSRWVVEKINYFMDDKDWPPGYFDLCGSIEDSTFKVHKSSPYSADVKRLQL